MSKKIYIGDQEIGTGSGDSFDPEYLEEDILDVSSRLEFLGDLTLDISARVDAVEQADYVVSNDLSAFLTADDVSNYITDNDISTFVTQSALDSSYISLESSVIALDASALAFDASIKELASAGGSGGSSDSVFIRVINSGDSDKVGYVNQYSAYDLSKIGNDSIILNGDNQYNHPEASGMSSVAAGRKSIASGNWSAAFNESTASGESSFSANTGKALGKQSFSCGGNNYSRAGNSFTAGMVNTANGSYSAVFGYNSSVGGVSSFSAGEALIVQSYTESAFGYLNKEYNAQPDYPFNGSTNVLVHSIGNGQSKQGNRYRHNALEVRQSGDIYVADVSAAGEYYEKPMINLQQKIYELEARIATLESQLPSA